ncbi:MAG TPA: hypothetical protein VMM77_07870, partial [Gemmatimonadaceae bacterium]|nr:hypothetical protein [Gemmatimonadaceae bacterium]
MSHSVSRALRASILSLTVILYPAPASTQLPAQVRPHLDWQSAETRHFLFHYPAEMEQWTLDVAGRMEAVHEAVSRYVGWAPPHRVHVIVDDPANVSNGSAWPLLGMPAILLWPTPPDPTSTIGHSRDWGELLAVHEYAHLAHLTRPFRNPLRRFLFSLLPATPGPLTLDAPRWVFEGYATVVEGALTGSGRPHGALRPALLRQRALEGRLPTYGQLDSPEGFQGGSMAYLAGSAYLEWLLARSDDSALVHLWRRMSARQSRGFGEAFAGVFGDSPQALYGRFTAELTANAFAVEDTLRSAGLVTGDTLLALNYGTGSPSVSPNDSLLAAVVRYRDRPSRIVVWQTAVDTAALRRRAEARDRILAADPEDVPAVTTGPPPRRQAASLASASGTQYDAPRFFPDGRRLLVVRSEPLGDGGWRGDAFIWSLDDGSVRRITRQAGVRDAAPTSDGARAIAVRCANGICDLVEIQLATGEITVLAPGSTESPWAHPASSPDDRWIAASRPTLGVWEIVLVERLVEADGSARAGQIRRLTVGDGASRYQPAWIAAGPLGSGLVVVSEAGGVANLELLPLAAPESRLGVPRTLTRVTGAATSPAIPRDGSAIYFLAMHAAGLDVNRLALADSSQPTRANPALSPAANLVRLASGRVFVAALDPAARDTFARGAVRLRGGYGAGPRRYALWPIGAGGAAGGYGGLALASSDPVGRLTWVLQGIYGDRDLWRGAALGATWRGSRPAIGGNVFYAEQRPSRQGRVQPAGLDVNYLGATFQASLPRQANGRLYGVRSGASAGSLDAPGATGGASRALGFAEVWGQVTLRGGTRALALGAVLHGSAGQTGGASWQRGLGTVAMHATAGARVLRASLTGGTLGGDAPAFESFTIGGVVNPLVDDAVLSQRISHPAIPLGTTSGTEVIAWRVATRLSGWELYLWNASALGWRNEQHRVVGVERELANLRLPIINIPGVTATAGAAYSIDAP